MQSLARLKQRLNFLYNGHGRVPNLFRYALLAFDLALISFFILSSFMADGAIQHAFDYIIGIILLIDVSVRLWISTNRLHFLWEPATLADIIVIGSLIASAFLESFSFLRVVRSLRLLRSFHVLRDLRERIAFFKRNEEIIQSILNLAVFIFFVTALVYVFQVSSNPSVTNYVDALYFTVTALTTTGFGDITLQGTSGRLLSITIMIVGVALFLRLVQTIFRPAKVHYTCSDCGLNRHDVDSVHCKHCGRLIKIEAEGV